jgi:hypothetical protein
LARAFTNFCTIGSKTGFVFTISAPYCYIFFTLKM